jgi:uncharacterized protein with GYD domain
MTRADRSEYAGMSGKRMAKYLGMVELSTAEATRIIRDGPSARRDHFAQLVKEAGGTLEAAWHTNVGDWDMICIVDMADASAISGAAAALARRAADLSVRERWIELVDIDEVTLAMDAMARGNAD